MQLPLFAAVPSCRAAGPGLTVEELARELSRMWPERGPYAPRGGLVEGTGMAASPGPPIAFAGRSRHRSWRLCDARMGLQRAIAEARLRSMPLDQALGEVTGWAWEARSAEGAWICVHGRTLFAAQRLDDSRVVVQLDHPACATRGLMLPRLSGLLSGLDLSLERWIRLVDPRRGGAGDVLADLDHARTVLERNHIDPRTLPERRVRPDVL
ncbi:MAG TPA: hypothetical protein PKA87_11575 [Microthrixaceae bacterium]|nr:hypothetical protein [Myxococcota bacterium]HMX08170.1 hypothetical protein [Microthrixaceae bacterium]HNH94985.1 hypothetical protein [Microthrixaceae bacterium]